MAGASGLHRTAVHWIVPTVFGWLAVFVLTLASGLGGAGMALLVGTLSLCLVLTRDFPRRSVGLLYSWVGPAIILVTSLVYHRSLGQPISPTHVLAPIAVLHGALVILMIWLGRGYGFVPFLCAWSKVASAKPQAERAANAYPWEYWWLVPLAFAALGALHLVILEYWLRFAEILS